MSANEIPYVPSSILKRKGDVSGFIDVSRHFMETTVNPVDGTMVSTSIFHPSSRTEQVTDIATFQPNNDISTVSRNKSVSKRQKNPFGDDVRIQDAFYKEMTEEILNEMGHDSRYKSSKKASKNISVTKQKQESKSMQAISVEKKRTKSQIAKSPEKRQSEKRWGDDTLAKIDNAVDNVVVNPARVIGALPSLSVILLKKGLKSKLKSSTMTYLIIGLPLMKQT
jgi:hypothetical protein